MATPLWRKAGVRKREAMRTKEIIKKNKKFIEKMRTDDVVAIIREDREE